MKKKAGKCHYNTLLQLADEIARLKNVRAFLNKQYLQMITALEKEQKFTSCHQEYVYLDGYNWMDNQKCLEVCSYLVRANVEKFREAEAQCAFKNDDCEALFLAKKSMKEYLTNKLTQELAIYNDVVQLYERVWHYHTQHKQEGVPFVRFSVTSRDAVACYCEPQPQESHYETAQMLMFFEKDKIKRTYQNTPLFIKRERDDTVLKKTCEFNLEQSEVLIQLCHIEDWMDAGDDFNVECLVALFKQMKDNRSRLIRVYGSLEDVVPNESSLCIKYFRQRGFKILGAFKED